MSWPRCLASQSTSVSFRDRTWEIVAMYFLILVLVIFVGFDKGGSHCVLNFLRQSQARMGSKDCLFGLANTYGFSSAMPTAFLVLIRTSIALIISGVKMTGTFLPRLPRISTMSSLNTTIKITLFICGKSTISKRRSFFSMKEQIGVRETNHLNKKRSENNKVACFDKQFRPDRVWQRSKRELKFPDIQQHYIRQSSVFPHVNVLLYTYLNNCLTDL